MITRSFLFFAVMLLTSTVCVYFAYQSNASEYESKIVVDEEKKKNLKIPNF